MNLTYNQISDISPTKAFIAPQTIYAGKQSINLSDVTINETSELSYSVVDIDGVSHQIDFDELVVGSNKLELPWDFSISSSNCEFTGTFNQIVNYEPVTTNTVLPDQTIPEEQVQNDQELIELFGAFKGIDASISVDQSNVNYHDPGKYPIEFKDEVGNTMTSNLVVKEVLPTLSVKESAIYVPINNHLDYIEAYGVVGTEITKGDLNSEIQVDDTKVNINKVGTYPVTFSVSDDEGNIDYLKVNVDIVGEQFTINSNSGFSKVYIQVPRDQNSTLGGYEYTIYDEDGNIVDVIITDENGYAESKDLMNGDYTIVLTHSPGDNSNSEVDKENNDDSESNEVADDNQPLHYKQKKEFACNQNEVELQSKNRTCEYFKEKSVYTFNAQLTNGEVAEGIKFDLVNANDEIIATSKSDMQGNLSFKQVEQGDYRLQLNKDEKKYRMDNSTSIGSDEDSSNPQLKIRKRLYIPWKSILIIVIVVFIIKRKGFDGNGK